MSPFYCRIFTLLDRQYLLQSVQMKYKMSHFPFLTPLFSATINFQAKMGFREGEGLGKFGQGRKEIVEASTQRGRRGLGLTLQGFQGELNVDWRDEPEVCSI